MGMIDARELRIGNWYCLTNPMNRDDMDFAMFDNWTQALEFEGYGLPIKLTPDILLRAGFEKIYGDKPNHKYEEWCGNGYYYRPKEKELYFLTSEIKMEYLHQLQNLHFALHDEELKINL